MDFYLPFFDVVKNFISTLRLLQSWDDVMAYFGPDDQTIQNRLDYLANNAGWPQMRPQDLTDLINQLRDEENRRTAIADAIIGGQNQNNHQENQLGIPGGDASAWQCYKRKLIDEKHYTQNVVEEIERSCHKTLKQLSSETNSPIKGLVIGNIQSGKTTNMAGLMAMAADWGWNMFIILSGTIEALRQQTQDRLIEDLSNADCNLNWQPYSHLSRNSETRPYNLQLNPERRMRYMTVCLKNASRLQDLAGWLTLDRNCQRLMRVLVIDDEADQAGINTLNVSDNDKTKINKLIRTIVNDNGYMAMNYVGYTATPYANVLNECGEDSLFPRNFIFSLKQSNEYFGPQQLYGIGSYVGLDVTREIPLGDASYITQNIHNSGITDLIPDSLKNAIRWFMCAVACMRHWKYGKPISMLIHTSPNIACHNNVEQAVTNWINSLDEETIIRECGILWDNEKDSLSKKHFTEQYPNYGRLREIRDYPQFDEIEPQLRLLIRAPRLSHIKVDTNDEPTYHDGIHLCVDNCSNNGTDDNNEHIRLVYPNRHNMPAMAPAFIVIGGNTLSRGLTLEGLVCTFFLRTVRQADTLMQMGRWFGYRRGYELLPRIWMTRNTINAFVYLSEMDQNLRDQIDEMEARGDAPSDMGVRILTSPGVLAITAANRMQGAVPADVSFSGTNKQTILFDSDKAIIQSNLTHTRHFLNDLGTPTSKENCYIWRDVEFRLINRYLKAFSFHPRLRGFNDIQPLISWIDKATKEGNLNSWNVIIAGIRDNSAKRFSFGDNNKYNITKVTRSLKKRRLEPQIYDIGVLREIKDIIADVDYDSADSVTQGMIDNLSSSNVNRIRERVGLGSTPQLIIYIIDKDSKATSQQREDLNAPNDLVGLFLNIPGQRRRNTTVSVTINLTNTALMSLDNNNS